MEDANDRFLNFGLKTFADRRIVHTSACPALSQPGHTWRQVCPPLFLKLGWASEHDVGFEPVFAEFGRVRWIVRSSRIEEIGYGQQ